MAEKVEKLQGLSRGAEEAPLSPEELMVEYKRTKDKELRNQLVLHYAPAIQHTIINMRGSLPQQIQQEEFFNQGILTLIDCIEKYDPDRGASFTTFIYKHLRGSILSYTRKHSLLPYRVRVARREIIQARTELSNTLMREPTERELAEHMGIPEKELSRNLQEISVADMVSFEEMISGTGGVAASFDGFTFRSGSLPEDGIDSELMRDELVAVLADAIDTLSAKEKQVVTLCYYENLNLREIGEVLGVSQQRISFIRSSALRKLRQAMSQYIYGKDDDAC